MTTVHKPSVASRTQAKSAEKAEHKSGVTLKGGVQVNGKKAHVSTESTLGLKQGALKGKGAALHHVADALAKATRKHPTHTPAATA